MTLSSKVKADDELDGYFYRAQNKPIWWCREFLGSEFWDMQKQVLISVRDNKRTSVTACHAVGKTFLTANAAIWFLMAHPDACVLLTAPTYRQVSEVLWRQIASLYETARLRGCPLGGKFYTEPKWELGKKWFMLGFSPQHPEKAQGFHAPYILIIMEEASGVPSGVHQALRGIMASGHVRLLMLGNPNNPLGEFYESFASKQAMYKTFQISAWDTPNLKRLRDACGVNGDGTLTEWGRSDEGIAARLKILRSAELVNKYLVSPDYVADSEQEYGWDSDFYRVRVLGQFPKGAPDQLVPIPLIYQATYRWEDIADKDRWWLHRARFEGHPVSALDVARFGGAESAWCSRLDTVAAPLECWQGLDAIELPPRAAACIRRLDTRTNRVDADGYGGGPYDTLLRTAPGIIEFRGGTTKGVDTERFANLRAQDFWGLRDRYEQGRIAHPPDQKLIGQVSSLRYKHRPSGQILMEAKEDLKGNWDRADALMMCYGCQPMAGFVEPQRKMQDWNWGQ